MVNESRNLQVSTNNNHYKNIIHLHTVFFNTKNPTKFAKGLQLDFQAVESNLEALLFNNFAKFII